MEEGGEGQEEKQEKGGDGGGVQAYRAEDNHLSRPQLMASCEEEGWTPAQVNGLAQGHTAGKAEGGQQGPTSLGQSWHMMYKQHGGEASPSTGAQSQARALGGEPWPTGAEHVRQSHTRVRAAPVGGSAWARAKDQVGRGGSSKQVPGAPRE